MSLSKKARFEVFKRDKFTCQYCGNRPPEIVLECDHIQPVAKGGSDDYSNLITSCFDCNRGKRDNELGDSDCENVQAMQLETIAQLAAFNQMLIESQEVRKVQNEWVYEQVSTNINVQILDKDKRSIDTFLRRLGIDQIIEASELTGLRGMSPTQSWRYFCGVCWRMIKESDDG